MCDECGGLGWWTISGKMLMDALRRVSAGENPEMVYAELYANSKIETFDADGEEG